MKLTIICGECGADVSVNLDGKTLPDDVDAECPRCGFYHSINIYSEQDVTRDAVPVHLKNKLETK